MKLWKRIRYLLNREVLDRELQEEMRVHREMAEEKLSQLGTPKEEAHYAAMRTFGNTSLAQEASRAEWTFFFETLVQDIRFGLRMLRQSPGFTAIVVLTLALGIGANTAIFSLINAVALRNLPVPNPQRLVLLQWTARHGPHSSFFARFGGCPSGSGRSSPSPTACSFSYPMFEQVRSMKDIFSGVFSYTPANVALRVDGHLERVRGMYVTGEFFATLGAQAAMGRTLSPNDDATGAEPVIVLSYRYWKSELGGDFSVLGKMATVDLKPFRVAGITSRDFPNLDPGVPVDFWMPFVAQQIVQTHPASRSDEKSLWLYIVARLKPGVNARLAEAALNAMFVPSTTTGPAAIFKPEDAPYITLSSAAEGLSSLRTEYKRPLFVLMTAVGLILLLACANVAGLMLARSSARQKEMAVRNALGAPCLRIVRQLLTESLMLSLAGGVISILFAELAARALVAFLSANSYVPLEIDLGIDARVLGFTFAVSAIVGILFGLAPALRDSRADVAPTLKLSGGPSPTTPRQSAHLSNILVVAQVVISILVLVGAGLLGRTVLNLNAANAGFKTENLLVFDVDMTASGLKFDDPKCDKLNEELQHRFAAIPGVSSASYSESPLLSGGYSETAFRFPGVPASSARSSELLPVGPEFFKTMGIPLIAGRAFTRADFESTVQPKPIIVNQTFARTLFGNANPLGRVVIEGIRKPDETQIVGIVGDTKYESIRSEVAATVFTPHKYGSPTFELRTEGDPKALTSLAREAATQVNPDYLIMQMMTQKEEIDRTIYQERIVATLSALFGLLALTLAAIGLYGLVAYGAARRTHEIGVRMAVGAGRQEVLWLTARLGLVLTLIGVVIGLGVAAGVTKYLQSLLYNVRPTDPWTFIGIAILLVSVATVGCYLPARRAMRVDPMVALRHE